MVGHVVVDIVGDVEAGQRRWIVGGQLPSSTHRHREVTVGDVINESPRLAETIDTSLVDVKVDDVDTVTLSDHPNTSGTAINRYPSLLQDHCTGRYGRVVNRIRGSSHRSGLRGQLGTVRGCRPQNLSG